MEPTLLFVYGTLRSDAPLRAPASVTRDWVRVGRGSVEGSLRDLGAYPGAAPANDPSRRVHGEVYRLPDDHALRRLDVYEGCGPDDDPPHDFVRARTRVRLDDGSLLEAWIYWYEGARTGAPVPSGDWSASERRPPPGQRM